MVYLKIGMRRYQVLHLSIHHHWWAGWGGAGRGGVGGVIHCKFRS